ncbi:voltage-gated potassium channel [Breoghania corrubedonensis]|uniref:Voltage-gated potassium channel n=1 Tax=Breoghania corrubedonensis TaxID=665038 RepID=A0A2T5VDE4_9HYPH|nr:cyclic nucleotide-gated ion channel [Breoghania corrubedonensis]PTW61754.1 voltage-gated potassium channel [Breoghania corrubedonensis]
MRVSLKRRIYELLEKGAAGDIGSVILDRSLIALILVNVASVILSTVDSVEREWGGAFLLVEVLSGIVFSAEYFARLWVADMHPPLRGLGPLKARIRYAMQPFAVIDLLAVAPFWLPLLGGDLRALVVFRLLRFLKLARYSPALRSLVSALASERRALIASFVIICGIVLVAATALHLIEGDDQPEVFGSIPAAIWWAIATVTTVGYGDVVPVSVAGKIVGGIVMLLGYGLLALPIGVVATAFAREIHSREFVITWGMVARVPLFEDLNAADIAEVTGLLHSQTVERGEIIAREGDAGTSMFFIASGTVEINLADRTVTMHEGNFFGEMAVLHRTRRSATVVATSRCRLLVLDGDDLHRLMRRNPAIARRVREAARERLAETQNGDMAREEFVEQGGDPARDD